MYWPGLYTNPSEVTDRRSWGILKGQILADRNSRTASEIWLGWLTRTYSMANCFSSLSPSCFKLFPSKLSHDHTVMGQET